jgi:2-desacetyl-2-hydroxyethyl bacteriochlorophyllide A dehydrogenase
MRALRFSAPGTASLVEVEPPEAGPGEALVRPRYVGLCGTDLELFEGTMPYFAEGHAAYPIQPGHEVTGVVVSGPEDGPEPGTEVLVNPVVGCGECEACASGVQVRCRRRRELGIRDGLAGGACELIAVPVANLHPVPAGVGLRDAVLAEPGVTALNSVELLGEVAGRRALVLGAGTLGLIAVQLLVARGAEVDVLVIEEQRVELVERLGGRAIRTVEAAAYPAVVEAAGAPAAAKDALRAVAPGGHIALAGVQPGPVESLELNEIVLKDATLRGILNGPGLFDRMLGELAAGSVDAAALIESEFELGEAEAALAALTEPSRRAPKLMLSVAP